MLKKMLILTAVCASIGTAQANDKVDNLKKLDATCVVLQEMYDSLDSRIKFGKGQWKRFVADPDINGLFTDGMHDFIKGMEQMQLGTLKMYVDIDCMYLKGGINDKDNQ